ncbi:DUF5131 family protein [Reyranella sp.]|uniref:DUF5131 family protein n=1 Tax=Reyranella sp. TaxID=1929291 RepID=UPI003D0B6568
MAAITGIEWTDHTWSPWIGCTRISAACDHCYAADYGRRFGVAFETGAPRRRTSAEYWKQPARWNRQAAAAGRIATVFPSLCDPFDSEVDPAWLGETLALFEPLTALRLLLLTKRPHLAAKYFDGRTPPANVALGVTGEDQKMADLRIPILLSIPAKVRFLSCEPLLTRVSIMEYLYRDLDVTGRFRTHHGTRQMEFKHKGLLGALHWIIAGGESGPKARPSHPDWFRALRDQCAAASVPFFFKQWGAWIDVFDCDKDDPGGRIADDVVRRTPKGQWLNLAGGQGFHGSRVVRVERRPKALVAALDGREHREVPAW